MKTKILIVVVFAVTLWSMTALAKPGWADFFTSEQYETFMKLVREYFQEKNIRVKFGDGFVEVKREDGTSEQLGLVNLAQTCSQNGRSEWKRIIAGHFDRAQEIRKQQQELNKMTKDYAKISNLLAVRIWSRDYLGELSKVGKSIVYQEDLEGTITVLVLDLPAAIINVNVEDAKAWNKSHKELFEIGLGNIQKNYSPEVSRVALQNGLEIILITGDDLFVTTRVLFLAQNPEAIGHYGSLIGIPNRQALISYPIEDLNVAKAISFLIPIINGMYTEGPGSISPYLYWYHDSKFEKLPYEIGKKGIRFTPPQDFLDMMGKLKAPASQTSK